MGLMGWVKVRILAQILDSVPEKEIADAIVEFGRREFGKEADDYLMQIRMKLASLTFELGKRRAN